MPEITSFDPTLVVDCFNIFIGCVTIANRKVAVVQGMEQLAAPSANALYRTFYHLSLVDPASGILDDIRRRFRRIFPENADFRGFPSYHTVFALGVLVNTFWAKMNSRCLGYKLPWEESIPVARSLVKVAQEEFQQTQQKKVSRWILCIALEVLSSDPPAPLSAIADCLMIVAVDLGVDVHNIATLDDRCASIWWILDF